MGRNLFEEKFTPRVADIQTSDLIYYDLDLKDQCFEFCEKRDFDFLPACDHRRLYRRNEADFKASPLSDNRLRRFRAPKSQAFLRRVRTSLAVTLQ